MRELKNVMDRCRVLVRGSVIEASDLDLPMDDGDGAAAVQVDAGMPAGWLHADLPAATAMLERTMIVRALDAANGNRAEAARRLGIHRQLLYAKIKEYGLGDP